MNHITDIIDHTRFADLAPGDLSTIRAHVARCDDCEQAFEAARLSSLLLEERVSQAAQDAASANPFFQTRVLAAWREQQAGSAWSLGRLWNTTGALVAS